MVLDTEEPETERHGNFTVAGVAHRGTDVDEAALWDSIDDYADDLGDAAIGTDRYAVMFDVDADSGEFTYVAGREVEDTDDLSAELTAVEIPQATYAVLEPEYESVEEMVREIHTEELDGDRDEVHAPVFERYDSDRDPTTTADREIYVPVRDDDEY
ncbi:GyrI-like domain-containing protein [Halosimplex pelagicum]|uniref:GyrI-like domain-containing protein n=1 Tax=Halosimplex pelagicum TaxID=869886 RepID=A0A7D5TSS1_9EURY|nr:GyrI-like domain-containing protein [Halosimplex pelagicum]QLH80814.1 GyrI-like domain-containing protein [Halosimplex pelagicum]